MTNDIIHDVFTEIRKQVYSQVSNQVKDSTARQAGNTSFDVYWRVREGVNEPIERYLRELL